MRRKVEREQKGQKEDRKGKEESVSRRAQKHRRERCQMFEDAKTIKQTEWKKA